MSQETKNSDPVIDSYQNNFLCRVSFTVKLNFISAASAETAAVYPECNRIISVRIIRRPYIQIQAVFTLLWKIIRILIKFFIKMSHDRMVRSRYVLVAHVSDMTSAKDAFPGISTFRPFPPAFANRRLSIRDAPENRVSVMRNSRNFSFLRIDNSLQGNPLLFRS